jgi:predicted component of type VI protein secretion system
VSEGSFEYAFELPASGTLPDGTPFEISGADRVDVVVQAATDHGNAFSGRTILLADD